jgi:drug/metabolite transporter (DMT)-like permease
MVSCILQQEVDELRYLTIALLILSVIFATTTSPSTRFNDALCNLYGTLKNILPPLIVVVIVLAAVIYAGGNILGQDVGAKSKSWATNMIIYAGISVIIFFVTPYILSYVAPELSLQEACPDI